MASKTGNKPPEKSFAERGKLTLPNRQRGFLQLSHPEGGTSWQPAGVSANHYIDKGAKVLAEADSPPPAPDARRLGATRHYGGHASF